MIRTWNERREAGAVATYTQWAIQFEPQPAWDDVPEEERQKWREIFAYGFNRYHNYAWQRDRTALSEEAQLND